MGLGGSMKEATALPERVWMEGLEPRVLLSRVEMLDLTQVVRRSGENEGEFQFQAKAGQQYLFLDVGLGTGGIHLLDSRGVQIAAGSDEDTFQTRLLWTAPASGIYTLWMDGGYWGNAGYDLVAGPVVDDYGDSLATAAPFGHDETIEGK